MRRGGLFFIAALFIAVNAYAQTESLIEPAVKLIKKKDCVGALAALNGINLSRHQELLPGVAYLTGVCLTRLDRSEEAKHFFEVASADPLMGDWALYQLTQIRDAKGEWKELLADAERFAKEFPYSPLQTEVALLKARAWRAMNQPLRAAIGVRDVIFAGYAKPEKALWELAISYETAGMAADGYAAYQRIYYEFPHTPLSAPAHEAMERIQRESAKGYLPPPSPAQRMKRVYMMMTNRMYKDAVEYINTLAKVQFTPLHRAELMMHLGRAHERLGQAEEAVAAYRQAAKVRDREIRPEALYRITRIYWNRDESEKTLETIKQIVREYATHEVAAQARYIEARMDESAGRRDEAIKKFENTAAVYPSGKVAEDCLWYAGWLRYLSGDLAGAEKGFLRLSEKYPNSNGTAPRALYWLARAMSEQGKDSGEHKKQLLAKYPFSYYAFLVNGDIRFGLAESPRTPGDGGFGGAVLKKMESAMAAFAPEPALDERSAWALKSARAWLSLGLPDTAKGLLDMTAAGTPKTQEGYAWLAWQYYKARCYQCVLRAADGIKMESLPPEQLQLVTLLMFPVAHWDAVSANADAGGMDPFIVLSIVRQESSFDPEIVSPADAHGLMQIIPSTAETVAGELGMGKPTVDDLHTPEVNIKLGAHYLAGLIRAHGGSLPLAFANYNAGPRPVERWKQKFPAEDVSVFIERIPYNETREYVKKVLRNYSVYRGIYAENHGVAMAAPAQ
ncbi:MAG: transglycosylase SLT domain-containing protein [Nitrospinae bacterium]|nr:transglycosylase SLT domain-containing protein [Nitrospinota bacterium]